MSGSLWRQTDFRYFWTAQGISQLGTQLSMLAIPLLAALTLGATPLEIGLLTAAGQAPALVFGLFAGAWIDRRRRKPVMVVADVGRALLFGAVPVASAADLLSIWLLAAIAFAAGTLTIFFDIGYLAYVPSLVGREKLVRANSALEATTSGAQVVGPGIGGALFAAIGGPLTLLIDALSFGLSAILLGRIRKPEPAPPPREVGQSFVSHVREGVRYVRNDLILRPLLQVSMFTNFFGAAFLAVYVLYMVRDLNLRSAEIGIVFAIGGVGALIGAVAATPLQERFGTGRVLTWSLFAFGATGMLVPLAVVVPTGALPLIIGAEFLQWLTLLIYSINAISLRQRRVNERAQGRVHATFVFTARGLQPLGSVAGGALGAMIGLPLTLVIGELGMFAAFALLLWSPLRGPESVLNQLPLTEIAGVAADS